MNHPQRSHSFAVDRSWRFSAYSDPMQSSPHGGGCPPWGGPAEGIMNHPHAHFRSLEAS